MVWSQLAELRTPPIVITDFLYLRFIGEHTRKGLWKDTKGQSYGDEKMGK
jgi:hypothetical protein